MSILNRIVEKKRERLIAARARTPLSELRQRISGLEKPRDFCNAIKRGKGRIRLIAELKKASPLKGVIREDFDPVNIGRLYEEESADALSILTEEDFFMGSLSYIPLVRKATIIPLLRKDFIFDEYQVYEARANGADAILLIAAILGISQAEEYLHLSRELGLSVLFEVHDYDELEMVLRTGADIIGINNRDLKNMKIDLNTTLLLKKYIPDNKVVVSESGIADRSDMLRLQDDGIDAVLIGTAFMESTDIRGKIRELCGK